MRWNDKGITIIELAATLAIMALAVATAASLIMAGMRGANREKERQYNMDLVERIANQVGKALRYVDQLEVTDSFHEADGYQLLWLDENGWLHLDEQDFFGEQYLGDKRLSCNVQIEKYCVRMRLELLEQEQVIYETETVIRLLNMELAALPVKTRYLEYTNQEGPVIFYFINTREGWEE